MARHTPPMMHLAQDLERARMGVGLSSERPFDFFLMLPTAFTTRFTVLADFPVFFFS